MIAVILAVIVIIPLVASPVDSRHNGVAAITFESLALLLATMLVWRSKLSWSNAEFVAFLRTGANLPILGFLILAFGSTITVPRNLGAFAVQAFLQLASGVLLYFVVSYQFRQSKHLSMLIETLLFLSAAISVLSLGGDFSNEYAHGTSLYGDHQPLGSVLMMLFPLCVATAASDKNKNRQLIALVVSVLVAAAFWSRSRVRRGWEHSVVC